MGKGLLDGRKQYFLLSLNYKKESKNHKSEYEENEDTNLGYIRLILKGSDHFITSNAKQRKETLADPISFSGDL